MNGNDPILPRVNKNGSLQPQITPWDAFRAEGHKYPEQIIDGLLYRGTKCMIAGQSKSYKSHLLMQMSVCVSQGIDFLGMRTVKLPVLYINMELPLFAMQARFTKMNDYILSTEQNDNLLLLNCRGVEFGTNQLKDQLDEISQLNPGVVVVDPIYKLANGMDENSAGEVGQMLRVFDEICEYTNAAVVFCHHFAKGNPRAKNVIDRASGSGVFARDFDTGIFISPHQWDKHFVLTPVLRSHPPMQEFTTYVDYPLMIRSSNADPKKLANPSGPLPLFTEKDILSGFGQNPRQWVPAGELKKRVLGNTGMSDSTYHKLCKQALDQNLLETKGSSRSTEYRGV